MTYTVTDPSTGARLATWPRALRPGQSPCRVDRSKGIRQHRCSTWHREVVEGFRCWVQSVEAEAEQVAIGYATETAEFYQARGGRPTLREYLVGLRDRGREVAA